MQEYWIQGIDRDVEGRATASFVCIETGSSEDLAVTAESDGKDILGVPVHGSRERIHSFLHQRCYDKHA